jgi:26S proteasome regulatory subunit, ATPase 3, interacting protein
MDDLTVAEILTCKEYGKSKIYVVNQDLFPTVKQEELSVLDEQIKLRKEEFEQMSTELKQLQASN